MELTATNRCFPTARRAVAVLAVCMAMLVPSAWSQAENGNALSPQAVLTDLGTLPPTFTRSQARGINHRGDVVGSLIAPGRDEFNHAFLYRKGTMINLGTLPSDTYSDAYAVNDRDQVVGTALYRAPVPPGGRFFHAFVWDKGVMTDIGLLLYPNANSTARDINNAGQVVGDAGDHAFLYQNGTMKDLGTLGGSSSVAYAINEFGAVVGSSTLADGSTHAFLYWGGTMHDLGTLGGTRSVANSINNLGQIVGTSRLADGTSHGFLYQFGHMIDLTALPGGQNIYGATWINDLGQILFGSSVYEYGKVVSFSGPLPPDGYKLFFTTQINDRGQIPGLILPINHAGVVNIHAVEKSQY